MIIQIGDQLELVRAAAVTPWPGSLCVCGYRDSGLPVARAACVVLACPDRYCPAGGLYPLVMDGGDGGRGRFLPGDGRVPSPRRMAG